MSGHRPRGLLPGPLVVGLLTAGAVLLTLVPVRAPLALAADPPPPAIPAPPSAAVAPPAIPPATAPSAAPAVPAPAAPTAMPTAPLPPASRQLRILLTGFSFQDNTPPNSAIISHPVLHSFAGGQGTYEDPITVAVPGTRTTMAWPAGTRFYLPTIRRYVIVEDSGASATPSGVDTHLDVWISGQGGTRRATDACMAQLTGRVPAILNPPPGLPVLPGPIFAEGTCHLPAATRP